MTLWPQLRPPGVLFVRVPSLHPGCLVRAAGSVFLLFDIVLILSAHGEFYIAMIVVGTVGIEFRHQYARHGSSSASEPWSHTALLPARVMRQLRTPDALTQLRINTHRRFRIPATRRGMGQAGDVLLVFARIPPHRIPRRGPPRAATISLAWDHPLADLWRPAPA
jgi:hypothetical protein